MIVLISLLPLDRSSPAALREKLYTNVINIGGKLPVIISPLAYVSKHAQINEGTIIMHHSLVNANAKIGKCNIINSKALIEHEAIIGDFCHISTGTLINGQVNVGDYCFIGSNTVVANNIIISGHSNIAAGSQVLKSVKLPGTYIGHPPSKNQIICTHLSLLKPELIITVVWPLPDN